MTNLNISLPPALAEFVEAQAARNGYSTSSEYVESLIKEDQNRRAKAELEGKLLEGLASERIEMNQQKWKELRDRFEQRRTKAQGQ